MKLINCEHCGKLIPIDEIFCPQCGSRNETGYKMALETAQRKEEAEPAPASSTDDTEVESAPVVTTPADDEGYNDTEEQGEESAEAADASDQPARVDPIKDDDTTMYGADSPEKPSGSTAFFTICIVLLFSILICGVGAYAYIQYKKPRERTSGMTGDTTRVITPPVVATPVAEPDTTDTTAVTDSMVFEVSRPSNLEQRAREQYHDSHESYGYEEYPDYEAISPEYEEYSDPSGYDNYDNEYGTSEYDTYDDTYDDTYSDYDEGYEEGTNEY